MGPWMGLVTGANISEIVFESRGAALVLALRVFHAFSSAENASTTLLRVLGGRLIDTWRIVSLPYLQ